MKFARAGFSLIELIGVLTLVAIVAGVVTVRWTGPYKAAVFRGDVERIIDFDFRARRHAAFHHRTGRLSIDLQHNQLSSTRWLAGDYREQKMQLAANTEIEQVVTVDGTTKSGTVDLEITDQGATRTYALLFSSSGRRQWIVFAGRTGQALETKQLSDVQATFRTLQLEGIDAR